jgi:hypothetical protein
MSRSSEPTVVVTEEGRSGQVLYRDPGGELSFYWEIGGGDAVAIVNVGTPAEWREQHPWAAARRAEILRFLAAELVRQKAPTCRPEIDDAAGTLYLRQVGSPPPRPVDRSSEFMVRLRRLRSALATVVFVLAALAAGAIWLTEKFLTIDPGKGTAIGLTVRTDRFAATIIQNLEPYVPSLHRDHSLDRYSLSLFLVPLDGTATHLIPVREGMSGNSFGLARILGSDGRTLWYDINGVGAVDLQTFAPLGEDALRKTPPPASLLGPMPLRYANEPATFLAAGYFSAPKAFVGLFSEAELEREYQPGKFVRRVVRAESMKASRRFYRATVEPDSTGKYHRIVGVTPLGEAKYWNAAFLRSGDAAEPFRLDDPGGGLMIYTSDSGLKGTTKLARVEDSGAIVWDVDTGIDRFLLSQILPGERSTVFVGPRPSVPDELSEPLLVIVDHATGKTSTHSLWQ